MKNAIVRIPPYLDCRDDASAAALDGKYSALLDRADVKRTPDGRWQALDPNQYDGFGPIGHGDTPEEAVADLAETAA